MAATAALGHASGVPPWAPIAYYLGVGGALMLAPAVMMKDVMGLPTPLTLIGKTLVGFTGEAAVICGIYLAAREAGKSPEESFGYGFAFAAIWALKVALLEGPAVGANKAGGLAWTGICAALSYAALPVFGQGL